MVLTRVEKKSLFIRLGFFKSRRIDVEETRGMEDDDLGLIELVPVQSELACVRETTIVDDSALLTGFTKPLCPP